MMSQPLRRFGLTVHVSTSVGWLGSVVAFLAIAVVGLTARDAEDARAAYVCMNIIGWFVIVPFSVGSFVSGLAQALGTTWGLFRHYWVVIKLIITVLATLLLLLHMQPVGHLARVVARRTLAGGEFAGLRLQLVIDAAAAVVVLITATSLSVYKPRGVTRYGRRKIRETIAGTSL